MSGRVVAIPGGTAFIRSNDEVRVRDKRRVEAASLDLLPLAAKLGNKDVDDLKLTEMAELGLTSEDIERVNRMQDLTILAYLGQWNRKDEPLPTLETIGDLDEATYKVLADETKEAGSALASKTDFDPPDPGTPGFEESPTEPFSASATGSKGEGEGELSTGTSLTIGESTDSAESSQD